MLLSSTARYVIHYDISYMCRLKTYTHGSVSRWSLIHVGGNKCVVVISLSFLASLPPPISSFLPPSLPPSLYPSFLLSPLSLSPFPPSLPPPLHPSLYPSFLLSPLSLPPSFLPQSLPPSLPPSIYPSFLLSPLSLSPFPPSLPPPLPPPPTPSGWSFNHFSCRGSLPAVPRSFPVTNYTLQTLQSEVKSRVTSYHGCTFTTEVYLPPVLLSQ